MTQRPDLPGGYVGRSMGRRSFLAGLVTAIAVPAVAADAWADQRIPAPAAVLRQRKFRTLPREHHTTTETSAGTMVVGGYYNGALSSVHLYDGQNWHEGPPMLTARYQHVAVPYGNGLIVAGGLSAAGDFLSSAELFDGQRWRRLPPMRVRRAQHAIALWNGTVVVTGGRCGAPISSVEVFDGTDWRAVAGLNTPRFSHSASVTDRGPVVSGGIYLAPLTSRESFDGQRWTLIRNSV